MISNGLIAPGYRLRRGSGLDRACLVKFMQRTYQELYPTAYSQHQFQHLAQTVDQHFSSETPLWWVDIEPQSPQLDLNAGPTSPTAVACLWMGRAIDQISGAAYPYVFLLYVSQAHRRRGLGSGLMRQAEAWAIARGDQQLGLQVFQHNQPALRLYQALGFQPQAIALIKSLSPPQT